MDAAYVSALSALGGATIGGLASFGSSWLTQRTQLRFAHHEAIKAKREALYIEFVDEAARLYGDALGHQKDEVADLVKIYALIGRIRLVSPRPVVTAAERTLDTISQTYLAPNRTLHEVMEDFHRGGSDFFAEFGEACRQDLGLDWAMGNIGGIARWAVAQRHFPLAEAVLARSRQEIQKSNDDPNTFALIELGLIAVAASANKTAALDHLASYLTDLAYHLPQGAPCRALSQQIQDLKTLTPAGELKRFSRAEALAALGL